MRRLTGAALALALLVSAAACSAGHHVSSAEKLRAKIARTVDYPFDLAVFTLDDHGVSYAGQTDRTYSFDSITKAVVGLVLASLVRSGDVSLDTRLGDLVDAGKNGDITLGQLATHTSGLPRLAPNADTWPGFDPANPYAGYTADLALDALRSADRKPGETYSNFGYQLLGLALERKTGQSLDSLARARVFEPAGMRSAAIRTGASGLPPGNARGKPAPAWDAQLGGAGAAVGTIQDLAALAKFVLKPPAGMAQTVDLATTGRTGGSFGNRTGLGWVTTDDVVWHNGASYGYYALVLIRRGTNRAAGFLGASGDLRGAQTLAFEFIGQSSLPAPPPGP